MRDFKSNIKIMVVEKYEFVHVQWICIVRTHKMYAIWMHKLYCMHVSEKEQFKTRTNIVISFPLSPFLCPPSHNSSLSLFLPFLYFSPSLFSPFFHLCIYKFNHKANIHSYVTYFFKYRKQIVCILVQFSNLFPIVFLQYFEQKLI